MPKIVVLCNSPRIQKGHKRIKKEIREKRIVDSRRANAEHLFKNGRLCPNGGYRLQRPKAHTYSFYKAPWAAATA